MGDVIALGQVKTFFVLVVEILDLRLGDGNLRRDFLVNQLIDGDALAQFGSDFIGSEFLLFQ